MIAINIRQDRRRRKAKDNQKLMRFWSVSQGSVALFFAAPDDLIFTNGRGGLPRRQKSFKYPEGNGAPSSYNVKQCFHHKSSRASMKAQAAMWAEAFEQE